MNIFNTFKQNKNYLLYYHLNRAIFLMISCAVLFAWRGWGWIECAWALPVIGLVASVQTSRILCGIAAGMCLSIILGSFTPLLLVGVPLAILAAGVLNGLIHNASHGNIKPRALNYWVGEFCGLIQLVGYAEWVIGHTLHHSFTDDPDRDPHPPGTLSFKQYLAGMRAKIMKVLGAEFMRHHGQKPGAMKTLKQIGLVTRTEHVLKICFWYLVLGPQWFAFFFAPSIIFKMLIFSWLNYSTHRPSENAQVQILNKDTGYYWFLNKVTFNLYFHGNHHVNPKLFDPKKLVSKKENSKKETADQEMDSAA